MTADQNTPLDTAMIELHALGDKLENEGHAIQKMAVKISERGTITLAEVQEVWRAAQRARQLVNAMERLHSGAIIEEMVHELDRRRMTPIQKGNR